MKKLFTAVGVAISTEMTAVGEKEIPFNFSHVVSASTREEAEQKTIDYYIDSTEGNFHVSEIRICDFIE